MDTLVQFVKDGSLSGTEALLLLQVQKGHKSAAVVKRANKLIGQLAT
jgi:hypothetical protein